MPFKFTVCDLVSSIHPVKDLRFLGDSSDLRNTCARWYNNQQSCYKHTPAVRKLLLPLPGFYEDNQAVV